jgi:hypothetical protein
MDFFMTAVDQAPACGPAMPPRLSAVAQDFLVRPYLETSGSSNQLTLKIN